MARIEKLYMVKCANMVTPDSFVFQAPNTTKDYKKLINVVCYILEHPTRGLIMVDTGVDISTVSEQELLSIACIQPTMNKRLAQIGKSLDDIKHVLVSHLHADHCGLNRLLPNATFHIRRTEWEGAHDPSINSYGAVDLDALREFEAAVPNPKLDLIPDTPEYDIFGDGSVISVDTKGHTPGHQSFKVNMASGAEMFLTMDAAHCEDELYDCRHFIISTWNVEKSLEQTKKLRAYRERTGNPLWMCHDGAQLYDAKVFPEYYE